MDTPLGQDLQAAQLSGKELDLLGSNPGMSPQVLASPSLGYHPQLPTFPGSLSQGLGCPQDSLPARVLQKWSQEI